MNQTDLNIAITLSRLFCPQFVTCHVFACNGRRLQYFSLSRPQQVQEKKRKPATFFLRPTGKF